MQGRQGQGDKGQSPQDRSSTSSFRLSELNGRQPVVPKRPSSMTRLGQPPPPTPRVARPQRENPRERKPRTWKWWLGCSGVVLVLGIVAAFVVYGVTNLFIAVSVSSGSGNTAVDFLSNLKAADYDQAYSDLDATLTVDLGNADFKQKALADDHCYGQVTDYNEVENSAVSSTNGGLQTFTYTYNITRSKMKSPYQMRLTLQKDAAGDWFITNYGGDLGPAPPTCS
jgi:hypothetical protein